MPPHRAPGKGVSVPMASALLTLLDPKRYGVIDIRVWQLLHRMGTSEEGYRTPIRLFLPSEIFCLTGYR
jgi:hypothetical protein